MLKQQLKQPLVIERERERNSESKMRENDRKLDNKTEAQINRERNVLQGSGFKQEIRKAEYSSCIKNDSELALCISYYTSLTMW